MNIVGKICSEVNNKSEFPLSPMDNLGQGILNFIVKNKTKQNKTKQLQHQEQTNKNIDVLNSS